MPFLCFTEARDAPHVSNVVITDISEPIGTMDPQVISHVANNIAPNVPTTLVVPCNSVQAMTTTPTCKRKKVNAPVDV